MVDLESLSILAEKYRLDIQEMKCSGADLNDGNIEQIKNMLIEKEEWTQRAADHLVPLALNYSSFMLRNALALSLALDIEDGRLRF